MPLFQIDLWVGSALLGWGLARVLSSLTPHLAAGRRVLWAPETILATVFVVLVVVFAWLDLWVTRTLETTDRVAHLLQVVKLFALHLAAAFVLPPLERGEAPINLHGYYDRARRLTFIPLLVALLAFWGCRSVIGMVMSPLDWAVAVLLPPICLALIFVRQRRANVALLAAALAVLGVQAAAYGVSLGSPAAMS